MLGPQRRPAGLPYHARKVPEVHGAVVGDKEGLAVYALVVERLRAELGRGEQRTGAQEVPVGDVLDVGEVEQVVIVAELEARAGGVIDVDHTGHQLDVAGAEDGGWADGES